MKKTIVAMATVCLILAFSMGAFAQAQHFQVYTINVKPGSEGDFASYMTKIKEAADKVGAPQSWGTWQAALGTSNSNYYVTLQFDTWGQRDMWDQVPVMLTKAFGEAEAQKILKMGGNSVWDVKTQVYDLDAERSWNVDKLDPANPPAHLQLVLGKIKPSMLSEYQRLVSSFKMAQEGRSPFAGIRRMTRFGPSWESYFATPFEKWSDWDKPDANFWSVVAKAHGEAEAAELRSRLAACYETRDIIVISMVPALSRPAPAGTSN